MLQELFDIFGNMSRAIETLLVMHGVKPAARMSVTQDELGKIKAFCEGSGLRFEMSDFNVGMQFGSSYSTKGVKTSDKGNIFIYISNADVLKAKKAEAEGDHKTFGSLLGYPDCCIDFFIKNKDSEIAGRNDYVTPALDSTSGNHFPFYMNIFGRYFDTILISHCPHSFGCRSSLQIAQKNFSVIQQHEPDIAAQIRQLLTSVAIYKGDKIILLTGYRIEENMIHFENVFSTEPDDFYKRLKEKKMIFINEIGYPYLLFE